MTDDSEKNETVSGVDGLLRTNIGVLAFGGGGGHIVDDLAKALQGAGTPTAGLVIKAFNTDRNDLNALCDDVEKIQIGTSITGGGGAGADPKVGKKAAEESMGEIQASLDSLDIAIFVTCLGGGTGSGATPVAVSEYKKILDSVAPEKVMEKKAGIIIATMPFRRQGEIIWKRAEEARNELQKLGLPMIIIPNDKLTSKERTTDRTIRKMLAAANYSVAKMIGRMIRALGQWHNVYNIDRNDIVGHLQLSCDMQIEAFYAVGYGKGPQRTKEALEQIQKNPLLQTELKNCKKVILSIDCKNAHELDWDAIELFTGDTPAHPQEAEWRYGLNDEFTPLPFEAEEYSDYDIAIFAIGIDHQPSVDLEVDDGESAQTTGDTTPTPPIGKYLDPQEVKNLDKASLPPQR